MQFFCLVFLVFLFLSIIWNRPGKDLITFDIWYFYWQDTVIYERLASNSKHRESTLQHLEDFATIGQ